jgi:imidazolonepropionase-like amidohydrolase
MGVSETISMRTFCFLTHAFAVFLAAPAGGQGPPRRVVLANATLIDGTGAAPRPGTTVVIENGRIADILPSAVERSDDGTETIDISGQFVVPGLVNTHVHFTPVLVNDAGAAAALLRRKLYGGVTTVRDAAGDARLLSPLQRQIAAGDLEGPDLFYAALFGSRDFVRNDPRVRRASRGMEPGAAPWQQEVGPHTDRAAAIRAAATSGASGLKFYIGVDAALIRDLTLEGHATGLRSWAHATVFPDRPLAVVQAGVDVVSHLCGLVWQDDDLSPSQNVPYTHTPPENPRPVFDPARVQPLGREMAQLLRAMAARGTLLDATLSQYSDGFTATECSPELMVALAQSAHQAGVAFTTGTDYFAPPDDEHPTVLRELEALVDHGVLTPMEALVAATRNGARALGIAQTHGTVERGKIANLVVLPSDPTASIRAFRTVSLVMKNGVVYERAAFNR